MSSCGRSHAELIGCFRLFLPRPVSLKKKKEKTRRTLITSSHTGRCRNGSSRRWRRAHDRRQEDLNWAGWMSGLIRALSGISLNPLPWLIARTHKRTQTAKPPWMQTSLSRSPPQSLSLSSSDLHLC